MRTFFGCLAVACIVGGCGSAETGGGASGDASVVDVGSGDAPALDLGGGETPMGTPDAGGDANRGDDARDDRSSTRDARDDGPSSTDGAPRSDGAVMDAPGDRSDGSTPSDAPAPTNDGSSLDASTDRDDAPASADATGTQDMTVDAVPPSDGANLVTKSFQQDVDGYVETKSVGISTYGGLGNVGEWNANGTTFGDGANDWCTGVDIPPSPYSEVWLLRFDDLGIPSTAHVVDATLTVYAYGNDTDANLFLDGRYLAASWNANVNCAGCSNAPVGWRYRDGTSAPWGALGAAASGVDQVASKSFRLPETGFVALGHNPMPYTSHIDPAVVQSWLSGADYGVRILTGTTGVHMGYVQPQRNAGARAVTMRPKLTITYEP